nr:MarR family transcriptional regulator [Litorivivens lipolytica]
MNFAAPLSLLAARPLRLTELADALGASKQLCLQSLKPIEQAGYIERQPDPDDKRARLVTLTSSGEELIQHAFEEMQAIQDDYEARIGAARVRALNDCLRTAAHAIDVPGEGLRSGRGLPLPARLSPLSRTLQERLMTLTARQGHNLQYSFGQVLGAVDINGTAIATLAQLNAVTTQAISRIAGELESLGYIERSTSGNDRRSRHIFFTPRGLELIRDSVTSVQQLGDELSTTLGKKGLLEMEALARQLYEALDLERGLLQSFAPGPDSRLFNGDATMAPSPPSPQTLLLFLAQQIAPELLDRSGDTVSLPSPLSCSADRLGALDRKLTAEQQRTLNQLLSRLAEAE